MKKVWFVTGASKGLGLALVKELLGEGYKVAATSRSLHSLQKEVGLVSESFLPLQTDLVDEANVALAIKSTIDHFGHIDVVVNNAGFGMAGALEELTDKEARYNFEVNVFGSLNVIRQALPFLRAQGSGHIFNVASVGGFTGNFPGFGIYCATKFAVHGFTESLAAEIKEFGLKATVVSPGYFRTEFLTTNSLVTPENALDAYTQVRAIQAAHENEINHNQPGSPEKAAQVFIKVAEMDSAPLHLFLGADAYQMAALKMEAVQKDLEAVKELATSTNY